MDNKKLSRRSFLRAAGLTSASAVLAACAPAAPATEAAQTGQEQPNQAAAPAQEVTINLTMVDYFESTKKALEEEIIPAFKEAHPNYNVAINYTAWNKYNEELTTAFAGGVTPDLMQGGAIFVPQFAKRDWILPLDSYISAASDWDWDDFMPSTQEDVTMDGKVMAIPYRLDVRTLWYRSDYLEEAGFDGPPTTWDELREYAKATTKTENGKITRTGFHFQPASTNWQNDFQIFIALLAATGGKFISDDLTKSLLTEAPALETANFMRALVFEDQSAVYPPFENQGDLGALHFDQGVMTIANEGVEINAVLYAPDKLPVLKAALPTAKEVQKTHVWINKFFISKLSPVPDDAWLLLEHMTSKKYLEVYTASFNGIPSRKSLSEADYFTENMKVLAKAAENASTYPKYHRMAETFRPTATALEEILRGQKDVETAMGEAAAAIDKILAEG